MKAGVVLVVKVDVSQVSAVIERMQQVLADEFGVPVPESAAAQADLPAEGSTWRHKDNPSAATWRVTSSRMSRVHARVFMGTSTAAQANGWTGTAEEFLNEFRPVKGAPEIGSRWMHRESDRLVKVQDILKAINPWEVKVIYQDGPEEWQGTVAQFNRSFTEATG